MRRLTKMLCAVAFALLSTKAHSAGKRGHVKFHPDWASHPATKYAAMTATECFAELRNRHVEFRVVEHAKGVLAPVRFDKDVGGVVYRTEVPEHLRGTNPYDVFDCRLGLALFDFSKILRAHDIDEVLMFSAWRPPSRRFPEGSLATRHPGGLAIDARRFGKKRAPAEAGSNGAGPHEAPERVWLDVERDFHGTIGAPPCGERTRPNDRTDVRTQELRSIACEAVDQHIFTSILTPNYNRAHRNHFHLEVTPGVTWYLVR